MNHDAVKVGGCIARYPISRDGSCWRSSNPATKDMESHCPRMNAQKPDSGGAAGRPADSVKTRSTCLPASSCRTLPKNWAPPPPVVPSAVAQGKFLSLHQCRTVPFGGCGLQPRNISRLLYQNDNLHEAACEYANTAGMKKGVQSWRRTIRRARFSLAGFKRFLQGRSPNEVYTNWAAQTTLARFSPQIRAFRR